MHIIDGNNVAGSDLGFDLGTRGTEEYIIGLVTRWNEKGGGRVILVFDGHRQETGSTINGNLQVRYPSDIPGATDADDVIVTLVKELNNAPNITAVTSDRILQQRLRRVGVRTVIDSRTFLHMLRQPEPKELKPEKPEPPTEAEAQEWADFMGIDISDPDATNKPPREASSKPASDTVSERPDKGDSAWENFLKNSGVTKLK